MGNKVTAYGGNLTYTLRYTPGNSAIRSRNSAFDVEVLSNDIVLRYFHEPQIPVTEFHTVSVPFYESYWERQDGQPANREHLLMALSNLQHILIKGTYTTITQEIGLKKVSMDYAESRNTGKLK